MAPSILRVVTTLCTLLWVVLLFDQIPSLCMSAVVVNASSTTRGLSTSSSLADGTDSGVVLSTKGENLEVFIEQTKWYNDVILGPWLPESVRDGIPHNLQTWLRNYVLGCFLYFFFCGSVWSLYIYKWKGDVFFPAPGGMPEKEAMLRQMRVTMKAMPMYSALPALSEYVVEKGWTKTFPSIADVGWPTYICLSITYFLMVEFGVYWIHRLLHQIKPLYKWIHATHHIDNKHTLSLFQVWPSTQSMHS